MVARRRALTSSPSSHSSNEDNNMAVDIPRFPLHYGSGRGGAPSDDEQPLYDEQENDVHDIWETSPVRNLSGSSSSSSSWDDNHHRGSNNSSSPPHISQVIHVPTARAPYAVCLESQQQRCRSSSGESPKSPPAGSSTLFLVGLVLIGMVAAVLSRSSVTFAVQKASQLASTRDTLTNNLYATEGDLHSLKRELMAMNALIQQQQEVGSHASPSEANKLLALNELKGLKSRIKELSTKGKNLKDRVQEISKTEIESNYGPGHKYVELELVFPDGKQGPTKFVIELATTEMPHSSHTFMQMAALGLLDGCSFILNSMNVLKAAPLPYDGSTASAKAKAFATHGLESVAFKEYNENYPHKKYTVGFAADGSPSFYINTDDNTDFHFGDPCFGKIVDGFDTIHRLESAPTRNGIWFAKKIGIKHAKIIKNDPRKDRLRQGGAGSSSD